MSEHIARWPDVETARSIVADFAEQRESHSGGIGETHWCIRIPFAIKSERISLDTDKIDEMGLFCSYEERWKEFEDTTIQVFQWNATMSPPIGSIVGDEIDEFHREHMRDQLLEHVAQDVVDACRNGFIARGVMGSREEYVERAQMDYLIGDYFESGGYECELHETKEKQYKVGTRRYGVDGVVKNRFWWETDIEAGRNYRVV